MVEVWWNYFYILYVENDIKISLYGESMQLKNAGKYRGILVN